jgi:hypothetical protein
LAFLNIGPIIIVIESLESRVATRGYFRCALVLAVGCQQQNCTIVTKHLSNHDARSTYGHSRRCQQGEPGEDVPGREVEAASEDSAPVPLSRTSRQPSGIKDTNIMNFSDSEDDDGPEEHKVRKHPSNSSKRHLEPHLTACLVLSCLVLPYWYVRIVIGKKSKRRLFIREDDDESELCVSQTSEHPQQHVEAASEDFMNTDEDDAADIDTGETKEDKLKIAPVPKVRKHPSNSNRSHLEPHLTACFVLSCPTSTFAISYALPLETRYSFLNANFIFVKAQGPWSSDTKM